MRGRSNAGMRKPSGKIAERAKLIRELARKPPLIIGPDLLEKRLSKVTGLSVSTIGKTLRAPGLRSYIRKSRDTFFLGKISKAIKQGHYTISGISSVTGLERDFIKAVLTRTNKWCLLPENMRASSGRLSFGGKKGSGTRRARTIERIVEAALKHPRNLTELARVAEIPLTWLHRLRKKDPLVDAIALGILSKKRPLSNQEKIRLLMGGNLLLSYLDKSMGSEIEEMRREIEAEIRVEEQ